MRFTITTSNHMWTFAIERDCLVEEMEEPMEELHLTSSTEIAEDSESFPVGFTNRGGWPARGLEASRAISCQACHNYLDAPAHVLGCAK